MYNRYHYLLASAHPYYHTRHEEHEVSAYSFVPPDGIWLKGNLHAHSTRSDGALSPLEVLTSYAQAGYDFISLTDHDLYATYVCPDLLCIPGVEVSGFFNGKPIHVNLFQAGSVSLFEEGHRFAVKDEEQTVQLLNGCRERYRIFLNHPAWSLLSFEDIADIDCLDGIEIQNYSTETRNGVDGSVHLWECGLRTGRRWMGYDSDDNHNRGEDSFGSWIVVKARMRDNVSVMEALSRGHFYTTEGPEIHAFSVIDGVAHVTCSPSERIIIKGEQRNFVRRMGTDLTELVAPLVGESRFVRVECTDAEGRTAYSNPLWL